MIYVAFWETADDVRDIRRLRHYEGTIQYLECYVQDTGRGGRETRLYVELMPKQAGMPPVKLGFGLHLRFCDKVFSITSTELVGRDFNAYFTAGSIMQLHINGKEVINFEERKRASHIQAFIFWPIPFAIEGLRRYMQNRRKKRLDESVKS
ncbi:hypothetical protein GCM10007891_09570 [Methylophaga thalassica]|uniref:Uncharacterized protein n=2 Tax=Methylophaga thalassica TaxID=40223 RepID=A0ABQ5TSZ6_9GAMM|nr:hypothetical protein GCM10007891_09570 [Methylophaga thalassica]